MTKMNERTPDQIAHMLALTRVPGVGDTRYCALVRRFEGADGVFQADVDELVSVEGINPTIARAIAKSTLSDDILRQRDRVLELGVTVMAVTDPEYPVHLAELDDAPALLFVQGDAGLLAIPGVAIVGTRRPSPYGKQVTAGIARRLARLGVTVVSGMARGVDGIAHRTALKHEGATVAVLGCGVDVVYPPESSDLHSQICENGAVVSEFWLGTPPDAPHFPRRNRIVSGLCHAVVVTEAPMRSGALITARMANAQNRDVYAVPGDITRDQSRGVNTLLAEGAQIVKGGDDLMESLGLGLALSGTAEQQLALPVEPPKSMDEDDRRILEALGSDPLHIDVVASALDRDASTLLTSLTLLEMQGFVQAHSGTRYTRTLSPA
jgi:DNA processing protein